MCHVPRALWLFARKRDAPRHLLSVLKQECKWRTHYAFVNHAAPTTLYLSTPVVAGGTVSAAGAS